MPKNMDFSDTYCSPDEGNVRYPSVAKKSFNGWAYVYTKDPDYVNDLSLHHRVEVRDNKRWVIYSGVLPSENDGYDRPQSAHDMDDDISDPNYEGSAQ